MNKIWTKEEKDLVIKLWNENTKGTEIAKKLGVSKGSIYGLVSSLPECKSRNSYNRYSIEQISIASQLWAKGLSSADIADQLNVDRAKFKSYINGHRKEFPKREQPKIGVAYHTQKEIYKAREEIEDPPRMIPAPENARYIPWIKLEANECQWGLSNDFYEPASNVFECCGLKVQGGKGVRRRFCSYHVKYATKVPE